MTPDLEVIDVAVVSPIPAMPLVLADAGFLSTLKQVEAQVASLKIVDAQSAQSAADLQARLTTAGKKLDVARTDLIAPFLAQQRRINDAAKAPLARIESAKQALKVALTNYANEQERLRQEAERKRQAELARLEAIRRAEAEAEEKRLAEIARQAEEARAAAPEAVVEDWDDLVPESEPTAPEKTAVEKQIDQLRAAPAPIVAKPSGVKFVTTLVPVVTDLAKLPDMFVDRVPRIAAIKATFCNGWQEGRPIPVCAGVTFEVKKEPQSTGRARF